MEDKRKLFFIVGDLKCRMCILLYLLLVSQVRAKLFTQLQSNSWTGTLLPNFRMMTQSPTESIDQFVTRLREKTDCSQFGETADKNIHYQVTEKCLSNCLRRKRLERGRNLTLNDLQMIARAMEDSDRQAGNIENSNQAKSGLNAIQGKQEKRCFRFDNTVHMQDDDKCSARNKECLKRHFTKCCKTKETKSREKKHFTKPKRHKGTVNQMNFDDYSDTENEYAYTIVDEKQPMVLVSIGGVSSVSMIVDSGASCNAIDCQLWESLKQKKVTCFFKSQETVVSLWQQGTIKNGWLFRS